MLLRREDTITYDNTLSFIYFSTAYTLFPSAIPNDICIVTFSASTHNASFILLLRQNDQADHLVLLYQVFDFYIDFILLFEGVKGQYPSRRGLNIKKGVLHLCIYCYKMSCPDL